MIHFKKMLKGYRAFRNKYVHGNRSVMKMLADNGQQPKVMVVSCCDSRVDPALILQCDPGDLFVTRNVANIVPPYEKDTGHHGTSAALEFGVCYLKVSHLIILGHSQCGGIQALVNNDSVKHQNDFITNWVSQIKLEEFHDHEDECAKSALHHSYENCLTFPWIKERIEKKELDIHLWYFDIKKGEILFYSEEQKAYVPLE